MEKKELVKFVSEFWKLELSKIDDKLKLDDKTLNNRSSIKFYQFIAKLESNFNVKVKNISNILTIEDLYKNIEKKK